MIQSVIIDEFLKVKDDGKLFHRENQNLEFKEQFNFAGLDEYIRDFAAFANNSGGYLIFGVTNTPRTATGLSPSSLNQFEKIDPEMISGNLLKIFSSYIKWDQALFQIKSKKFGVFKIYESNEKPVIAKKDEGRQNTIKNGEIYYRYGGRTQKIQYAELENIINQRIENNNKSWIDLVQKIGSSGPNNAAILDIERSVIEKDESQILVIDESLTEKIKFIREGAFSETSGSPTLKLVGDVVPVDQVEVIRRVKENLTKQYPLSAMELAALVKDKEPTISRGQIWDIIRENELKENKDYSAYNFRNMKQEQDFNETGRLPKAIPSIYNHKAVDFILQIYKQETE